MRFAFASLLALATATGCAAQAGPDDDASPIDADESELRAACTLGAGCPDAIKVFAATTLQSVPRVEARDDVTVDFNGNPDWVTEPFATGTTRKLVSDGKSRVVLTGSADGTAPIVVDDFLLVEVLAESGQVLAKGTVNPGAGVLVDGVAPASLANGAPWGGPGKGWSYGQVDITGLLPAGKTPFRIRVSAFDITSFATTTAVYVKTVSSAPPPPPPPPATPWANPCGGPAVTYDQLLSRFAPASGSVQLGSFVLDGRMRACHEQTGCTDWQPTHELPLYRVAYRTYNTVTTYRIEDPRAPRFVAVPAHGNIALRAASNNIGVVLTVDSAPFVIDTIATRSRGPLLNNYKFDGGLWQMGNLLKGNSDPVRAIPEKLTGGVMTNSCLFTTGVGRVQNAGTPTYTEYQMVLYGTY